jgi:hypothetical protein
MPNVVIEFKKDSCQVLHSTVPEVEKPRRTRLLKRELSCKSAKTERHPLIRSQPRSDNAKQTVLSLFKLYFPLKHTFAGGLRDNNSRGLWASLCNKRTLHPKHTTHPRKNPPSGHRSPDSSDWSREKKPSPQRFSADYVRRDFYWRTLKTTINVLFICLLR